MDMMDDASDIDRLNQPHFDTNAYFKIFFVLGF